MSNNTTDQKVFEKFTNLYSLSKTLRFELKPYLEIPEDEKEKLFGEDKEYYKGCKTYTEYYLKKTNKEHHSNEKAKNVDLQLINFLHDQQVEDAYQILKPVFDKLHEEFITKSLEGDAAKKINFEDYYNLYAKQKGEQDKDKKKKIDKPLETERGKLRRAFTPIYEAEGENFKDKAGKDEKDKLILKESSFKVLTEAGILKYIKNNIDGIAKKEIKDKKGKEITKKDIEKAVGNENNEGIFNKFFTYFGGFNQNRENYYSDEEKTTAVASRIVDENLPKFCDNVLSYKKNKSAYLQIFDFLEKKGKDLKLKNSKFGKDNEPEFIPVYDIKNDEKSFSIGDFVNCLSQNEIERYNAKISNANYLINLYNQNKDKGDPKLSMFKILYKQIGCGEKKDFITEIKNDNELKYVLEKIAEAGKNYFTNKNNANGEISNVFDFVNYIQNHENYKGIYWSDKALNNISSKYFANWNTLKNKLGEAKILNKNTGEDKADNKYKIPQAVMLADLFAVLDKTGESENWREKGVFFKASLFEGDKSKVETIENVNTPSQALVKMICDDIESLANNFIDSTDRILKIPEVNYRKDECKQEIKNWLDNALGINQILKYFKVKANKIKGDPVDAKIENSLDMLVYSGKSPANDYDAVRNYLTKKPQDEINKLKLNFKNASLADGWDENKEKDNSCTILREESGRQYLAVMRYEDTKIFEQKNGPLYSVDSLTWTKMVYKLIPGASKTLPKIFFSKKWTDKETLPDNIIEIYKNGSFKKENVDFKDGKEKDDSKKEEKRKKIVDELKKTCWVDIKYDVSGKIKNARYVNKEKLAKLINFYKENLKRYPSKDESWNKLFAFKFSNTETYRSIDQFYIEVDKQGYKLEFIPVNKTELEKQVKDGKIYLFKIRSRDNNLIDGKEKTSAKNLQTIYWNAVFDKDDNKPKLNGKAEIFYRPALPAHKMKKAVKIDNNGNEIEIKLKNGKTALQNFRFSKEKFIFHCPITLNFCLKETKLNDKLNTELAKPENKNSVCFLGIDRGEKHLAYYSLINQDGNILKQGSFNLIKDENTGKETDYLRLLEEKAGNRDEARKNWTTIGTIKELKNGYISQVIREIVDLAIYENIETKELRKMPAFIVLEDLNIGFKRGRQKIEKQVYQKLELALAKKLNFLVEKKAEEGEIGSVTKAIQLTPQVNNFGDIENRKQFGNMLYIRADYTSQTDPITGWRKSIYLKSGSEEYIKEQIVGNKEKKIDAAFDDIRFDGKDYYFSYTDKNTKKPWKLYSSKDGISLDRYFRELAYENSEKKWKPKKQNLIEMFSGLFDSFDKKSSLLEQLENGKNPNKIDEHTAWESLRFAINLVQQIRNSGETEADNDFILSPVRNINGNHFDSRKTKDDQPTNGDANGAYNIARKGIVVAEHIKRGFDKLYISDQEWDAWLAGEDVWEEWLKKNKENPIKIDR